MYGRLGGMYFLHLAEASAQRRRLAEAGSRTGPSKMQPERPERQPMDGGVMMFLRLVGVLGVGLAAIVTLSVLVG
jgi:hypothetical protein